MFEINEHQGQSVMEIVKYCTRCINSGMSRHWVNISPAFPQGSLGRRECLTLKIILRNLGNSYAKTTEQLPTRQQYHCADFNLARLANHIQVTPT